MDKATTRGVTLILGKRRSGKTTKAKEIIQYSAKPEQKIYVVTSSSRTEEYEDCSFDTYVYPFYILSNSSLEDVIDVFKEKGLETQVGTRYVILDNVSHTLIGKDLPLVSRKYNIRFIVISQEFRYLADSIDCIYGMGITTDEERNRIKTNLGIKLDDYITHFKYDLS